MGRIQRIELVDLAAVANLDVPTEAVLEHPRAQLVHFIQDPLEPVFVECIDYDNHGHPLPAVIFTYR